jgi:hypothetical protein
MLFYIFSAEELRGIFARLGYALPPDLIPATVRYYLARTSHGSTLSRLAHSWVLARTDRRQSWALFEQALEADLADTQGGTTQRRHPSWGHGRNRRHGDALLRRSGNPAGRSLAAPGSARRTHRDVLPAQLPRTTDQHLTDPRPGKAAVAPLLRRTNPSLRRGHRKNAEPG